MKHNKVIEFEGCKVLVSQIKHWLYDTEVHTSGESQMRFCVLKQVFRAWQTLDASILESLVSETAFEYCVDCDKTLVSGKTHFLSYISQVFESMRRMEIRASLELVQLIEGIYPVDYVYAIHMRLNDVESMIVLSFVENKIRSIRVCDADVFVFQKLAPGVLDANGEQRIFKHQALEGLAGTPMSLHAVHAFAVQIIAMLMSEEKWVIKSINPDEGVEYPNIVAQKAGQKVYILVDATVVPNQDGRRSEAGMFALNELARMQRPIPYHVVVVVGLYCMDTKGASPIAGGSYVFRIFQVKTTTMLK